jgi:hypothetical protein
MRETIPVVFVRVPPVEAGGWDDWVRLFGEHGYQVLVPDWPQEPAATGGAGPEACALTSRAIREITDHYAGVITGLNAAPVVIGHAAGAAVTQRLHQMRLARAGVIITPGPGQRSREAGPDDLFSAGIAEDGKGGCAPLLTIAGAADPGFPEHTVRVAFGDSRHRPPAAELHVLPGRSPSPGGYGWRHAADCVLDFLGSLARNGRAAAPAGRHAAPPHATAGLPRAAARPLARPARARSLTGRKHS